MSWKVVSKIIAWAAVVGALVAAVLGADKLGIKIFPTGKDTGCLWKPVSDSAGKKQQLVGLVTEADVTCVVRVKIKDVQQGDQFSARYEGYPNAPVQLLTMEPSNDKNWFDIHLDPQKGTPATDSRFTLYPYGRLVIENPNAPMRPIEAADWELWSKELGGHDGPGAITMRGFVYVLFWFTLLPIFAQALVTFKLLPDGSAPALATPESTAAAFIDRLHGANDHETKLVRKLVERMVIRNQTSVAACKALGIPFLTGNAMLDRVRPDWYGFIDATSDIFFRI